MFSRLDVETGMPRKAKKQAAQPEAAKSYDEFDDGEESGDDDSIPVEEQPSNHLKSRDWRDVEKLQEERRLRNLDRKSVVSGKSVSVRVDLGGRRIIKKKKKTKKITNN